MRRGTTPGDPTEDPLLKPIRTVLYALYGDRIERLVLFISLSRAADPATPERGRLGRMWAVLREPREPAFREAGLSIGVAFGRVSGGG